MRPLRPFWGQFEANCDYLSLFKFFRGHFKPLWAFFVIFHGFLNHKIFSQFFFVKFKKIKIFILKRFGLYILNYLTYNKVIPLYRKLFFEMNGVRGLCDKNSSRRYGPESYSHFFSSRSDL